MAIIYKCDMCGEVMPEGIDITATKRPRLGIEVNGTKLYLEVILGVDNIVNSGHVCNKCLAKALVLLAEQLKRNPDVREFKVRLDDWEVDA